MIYVYYHTGSVHVQRTHYTGPTLCIGRRPRAYSTECEGQRSPSRAHQKRCDVHKTLRRVRVGYCVRYVYMRFVLYTHGTRRSTPYTRTRLGTSCCCDLIERGTWPSWGSRGQRMRIARVRTNRGVSSLRFHFSRRLVREQCAYIHCAYARTYYTEYIITI